MCCSNMAYSKPLGAFSVSGSVSTTSRQQPRSNEKMPFGHATGRFSIGSLDDNELTVVAQYNPSELSTERSVNWKQHDLRDNRPEWLRVQSGREGYTDDIEYTGSESRTLSFDLVLDGFEKNQSIEPQVRALEEMACVRLPDERQDDLRRPHHCVVVFGEKAQGSIGKVRCVITKLAVKYSMFNNDGIPVRANVSLTVKEAIKIRGFDKGLDKTAADREDALAKEREQPNAIRGR